VWGLGGVSQNENKLREKARRRGEVQGK